MIPCDITGRNFELETKVKDYATDKIGALEKFVPRQMRQSTHAQIVLELDPNGREDNQYVCEVVLGIHGEVLTSKEGTINIYAAIDIVEAKLRHQLRTLKSKQVEEPRRARMLTRLMGKTSETDPANPVAEPEV